LDFCETIATQVLCGIVLLCPLHELVDKRVAEN